VGHSEHEQTSFVLSVKFLAVGMNLVIREETVVH